MRIKGFHLDLHTLITLEYVHGAELWKKTLFALDLKMMSSYPPMLSAPVNTLDILSEDMRLPRMCVRYSACKLSLSS